MRLGLGFGTRRGGACLGAFTTAPATEYTVYAEKTIAGTSSRDEALVLAWDAAGADSIDVVTPVGGVWSTTITARECDYGNTTVYLIQLSTGQVLATLAVSVVAPAVIGDACWSADYDLVLDGSDVAAWVSQWGNHTAYCPAEYGLEGVADAPTTSTSAFSGSRLSVSTPSGALPKTLHCDSGWEDFTGVLDSLTIVVAAHMVTTTNGYLLSVASPSALYPYFGPQTYQQLNQRDDANANGNANGGAVSTGVEHVLIWEHKPGQVRNFWVDGTPYGGNPVSAAGPLGQATPSILTFFAMRRTYFSSPDIGDTRRIAWSVGHGCTDAEAIAVAGYWLTH